MCLPLFHVSLQTFQGCPRFGELHVRHQCPLGWEWGRGNWFRLTCGYAGILLATTEYSWLCCSWSDICGIEGQKYVYYLLHPPNWLPRDYPLEVDPGDMARSTLRLDRGTRPCMHALGLILATLTFCREPSQARNSMLPETITFSRYRKRKMDRVWKKSSQMEIGVARTIIKIRHQKNPRARDSNAKTVKYNRLFL